MTAVVPTLEDYADLQGQNPGAMEAPKVPHSFALKASVRRIEMGKFANLCSLDNIIRFRSGESNCKADN